VTNAKNSLKTRIQSKPISNTKPIGISKPKFKTMTKNKIFHKEKIQQQTASKSLLEKITPNKIEASVTPIPGVNLKATWELKSKKDNE
jgi:hypothetical protein